MRRIHRHALSSRQRGITAAAPAVFAQPRLVSSSTPQVEASARESRKSEQGDQQQQQQQHEQKSNPLPRRRITKRTNYADRDAVYEARHGTETQHTCDASTTTTDAHFAHAVHQYEQQLRAAQATTRTSGHVGGLFPGSSRPTWRECRERVLLELLQTRRFGVAWIVGLWWRYVMAYAAYVGLGGHIEFYTRRTVAPPPSVSIAEQEGETLSGGERSGAAPLSGVSDISSSSSVMPRDGSEADASHVLTEAASRPSRVQQSRGVLKDRALDAVYIGSSHIHSRGLFTSTRLARGTRIITEAQRSFLLIPSFLRLLADTHEKLPDTWHYTHPSGALPELIVQAQPHHLFNHSCEPNVVSGLSPAFWEAAVATGRAELHERVSSWVNFADPNSFFVSRDVEAGEELTLDYSVRVAPMTAAAAASSTMDSGAFLQVCHCGSPLCRQFIYRARPELHAYLHKIATHPNASCFDTARDLLGLGVDDESVLLSLLPSRAPLVAYIHGKPLPELAARTVDGRGVGVAPATTAAVASADMQLRKFLKGDIIVCYRHVFRDLNEAAPIDVVANK